jgi:hypothetical protein
VRAQPRGFGAASSTKPWLYRQGFLFLKTLWMGFHLSRES